MSAHPGIDGLAGAISGMASVFVGHPLDTLRTKAQVHTGNSSSWAIAKKMVANEGVAGLFRGVLPPLLAVGLASTVAFSANEWFQSTAFTRWPNPSGMTHYAVLFTAGFGSGVCTTVVSTPTMFLKVQLQTMKSTLAVTHPVRATIEAGKSIVRELGWRGFYRCLPSQVMCEATGRGFHFGNYELIKSFFGLSVYTGSSPVDSEVEHAMLKRLAAAAIAGSSSWLLIMPMDVIRSNIMAIPPQRGVPAPSAIQIGKQLYRSHGWRVFFRGLGVTMIRSIPVSCTSLPMYDYMRRVLADELL